MFAVPQKIDSILKETDQNTLILIKNKINFESKFSKKITTSGNSIEEKNYTS